MDMDDELQDLLASFGFGEMPNLSEVNTQALADLRLRQIQMTRLQAQSHALEDDIRETSEHVQWITSRMELNRQTLEKLESDEIEVEGKCRLRRNESSNAIKVIEELQVKMEESQATMEKLTEEVEQCDDRLDSLYRERDFDSEQRSRFSEDIKVREDELATLFKAHGLDIKIQDRMQRKLDTVKESHNAELKNLSASQGNVQAYQARLDSLTSDYKHAWASRMDLEIKCDDASKLLSHRDSQLSTVLGQLKEIRNETVDARQEMAKRQYELGSVERTMGEISSDIDKTERQISRVQCQISHLRGRHVELDSDLAEARHKLSDVEQDVTWTESQIVEAEAKFGEVQSELGQIKSEIERNRIRHGQLKTSRLSLDVGVENMLQILRSHEMELAKQQKLVQSLNHDLCEKTDLLAAMQEEVYELKNRYKSLRRMQSSLVQEADRTRQEHDDLQRQIANNQAKISYLDTEIERYKNKHYGLEERARKELEAEFARLSEKEDNLRRERRAVDYMRHKAEANLIKISSKLEQISIQSSQLKTEHRDITTSISRIEIEKRDTEEAIAQSLLAQREHEVNLERMGMEIAGGAESRLQLQVKRADRAEEVRCIEIGLAKARDEVGVELRQMQKRLTDCRHLEQSRLTKIQHVEERLKRTSDAIKNELKFADLISESEYNETSGCITLGECMARVAQKRIEFEDSVEAMRTKCATRERNLSLMQHCLSRMETSNSGFRARHFAAVSVQSSSLQDEPDSDLKLKISSIQEVLKSKMKTLDNNAIQIKVMYSQLEDVQRSNMSVRNDIDRDRLVMVKYQAAYAKVESMLARSVASLCRQKHVSGATIINIEAQLLIKSFRVVCTELAKLVASLPEPNAELINLLSS